MSKGLKYIEFNGFPVVSARDLYSFITNGEGNEVYAWITFCSNHSMMVEGEDFHKITTAAGHNDILMVPTCASVMCGAFKTERAKEAYSMVRNLLAIESIEDSNLNSTDTSISISQAAKIINYKGGPNALFSFLKEAKILMCSNVPYQNYINGGHFKVKHSEYQSPNGQVYHYAKTFVTKEGLQWLSKIVRKNKELIAA